MFLHIRLLSYNTDCRGGASGESTGQGCVVVDVEFEEVVERVGDGDGAVYVGFDAVVEGEREIGFGAGHERDVF